MSDAWDGRPQNPERAGPHAMQHIATGNIEVKLWTTHARHGDQWCWIDECGDDISSDTVAKYWSYIGPCLTPSEVAAREAAAALAMREAAKRAALDVLIPEDASAAEGHGRSMASIEAAMAIAALPLPDTSALDALLAQARCEALEAGRTILWMAEEWLKHNGCDAMNADEHRAAIETARALLTRGGDA